MEFREASYNITAKNERAIKPGMTFNVSVGFHNIDLPEDAKHKTFSLLLADTVLITPSGAEVLTDKATKSLGEITYEIEVNVLTRQYRSNRIV